MADKKKKGRKLRVIFLILAVPIAAAYAYLCLVPFDITHKIPELREKIKPNLYGDINAKSLYITFLPRPKIYATDFVLTSKLAPVVESQEDVRDRKAAAPYLKKDHHQTIDLRRSGALRHKTRRRLD